MSKKALLERNAHAAQDERAVGLKSVQVVTGADADHEALSFRRNSAYRRSSGVVTFKFFGDPATMRTGAPCAITSVASSVYVRPSAAARRWASRRRSMRNTCGVWQAQRRLRSGVDSRNWSLVACRMVSTQCVATVAAPCLRASLMA